MTSEPQSDSGETQSSPSGAPEAAVVDPLLEAEAKVAALKDQLLRTAADFDNYRKRSRREIEDAQNIGREGMLKDLLPVFDNLERATAHADTVTDVPSFVSGLQMVMRQFEEVLRRVGIERVPALGTAFDPTIHEAIQHLETNDVAPGRVAAEVQPGYRLGGRLLRPALVVVAKAKPISQAGDSNASDAPETDGAADGGADDNPLN